MSKDKVLNYLATAVEITKMVLVISTNTAIKLFYEGKNEIIKQYAEYNQKNYYRQKETLQKLRALTEKASAMKVDAHKKVEHMAEEKKKLEHKMTEEKKKLEHKMVDTDKKGATSKEAPPNPKK